MTLPTGNEHKYTGNYSHCPPDVIKAIGDYEANVKSGVIAFDDPQSIMATDYPQETGSDRALAKYVTSHVAES